MITSQDILFFIFISLDIFFLPEYPYFNFKPAANEKVVTEN